MLFGFEVGASRRGAVGLASMVHWFGYTRRFKENFVVKQKLGQGAFGSTYKCIEKATGHVYAVKVGRCLDAHVKLERCLFVQGHRVIFARNFQSRRFRPKRTLNL